MLNFLNKKNHYDSDGFDSEGYNRLGLDRMGYDRDGYDIHGYNKDGFSRNGINKITGLDADGYNADGFDRNGFDRNGFDRDGFNCNGFNSKGFDRNGFDHNGFDKFGYNKAGFNANGFDRNGYDKNGYDKDGFNKKGFDKKGFDREGFDKNGYDIKGFNHDGFDKMGFNESGYDHEGFDRKGFDHDGFDRTGFNESGYDHEGFDREGFDHKGFDRKGYDKKGFDHNGFDVNGFDKNGFDKNGYDRMGLNNLGFDKDGFDLNGFDSAGFDRDGYDKKGFSKEGLTRSGYSREEFDENGFHKYSGLDAWGFNKYGFNINGINKYTKRDRLGFDADGFDIDGFNIWGINPETEKDKYENPLSFYNNDCNFTEQLCEEFQKNYYEYMAGKFEKAIPLSRAYCYGKGTVRDFKKALLILFETAYEHDDKSAINELSDLFYTGDIIKQNIDLALYLKDLIDTKQSKSINQYKARQALKFEASVNTKSRDFLEEQGHFEQVLRAIRSAIKHYEESLYKLDSDTSWMDNDQRLDWVDKRERNHETYIEINKLKIIEEKPYYGRMDVMDTCGNEERNYIGENYYFDYNSGIKIASVWSQAGRKFRDRLSHNFLLDGKIVTVTLKRKYVIENHQLLEYFDEYDGNSVAAKAEITDPYLLHILEEKRGEKNITNIIRTIQSNQNSIIEEKLDANFIVQGCAGSGKTMILLHRLANLKFNNMSYDWNNVRIITPNRDFSLFIDDLSRDLSINDIDKITLSDYYIELITQYYSQHRERTGKNGFFNISLFKNYSASNETKKIKPDREWDKKIVEYIYSNSFKKSMLEAVSKLKALKMGYISFGTAWVEFNDTLSSILKEHFNTVLRRFTNYNCILYAKVLFLYDYFGPVGKSVKMLCIDEGQDISENQYALLYEVNAKRACMNIYGDLSQRVSSNVNISDWINLKGLLKANYYELNENYRNSENIIEFYNEQLGINNKSFGLNTKPVERFREDELNILVKLQLLLKNRTVIITKDKSRVPASILSQCVQGGISEDYISVMDILEVKGLEFDTAFVFDEDMDENERYISYTRALSELYIQSDINGIDIALGVQDEKQIIDSKQKKRRSQRKD